MAEPLKNMYNAELVHNISSEMSKAFPAFNTVIFLKNTLENDWERRELKDRMRTISTALQLALNTDFKAAIDAILVAAPNCKHGFENIVFPDFVEVFGLGDWNTSMHALKKLTSLSSSEFAVRPFIIQDEDRALALLFEWSSSENEHIRRLSSEGCRPRLPWAMALPTLKKDPTPILPILENLKEDDSLYVRKSVANNLNDISKDHPELVVEIAYRWYGKHKYTDWIVKHALRTLLKQGKIEALRLFGFQDPSLIQVHDVIIQNQHLKIGDTLHFEFELELPESSKLRLEYAITYAKKNGASRKVFQISEREHKAGRVTLKNKQSVADMSTRKHYPGPHELEIIVNGETKGSSTFDLS